MSLLSIFRFSHSKIYNKYLFSWNKKKVLQLDDELGSSNIWDHYIGFLIEHLKIMYVINNKQKKNTSD